MQYTKETIVAPFTGAWIEISCDRSDKPPRQWSHPSRVRGLKCRCCIFTCHISTVAPFTGAWIEIRLKLSHRTRKGKVAPFTGAWIEMAARPEPHKQTTVAPFTGAWIEIYGLLTPITAQATSHPSRVRGLKLLLLIFRE